jgi:hypothetical protein
MLDPDQSVGVERHDTIWREISSLPQAKSWIDLLQEVLMSDPTDAIAAAIRSAFDSFPKEDDPDWRGPSWITPNECAHLTRAIMQELEARGFQIVKKPA